MARTLLPPTLAAAAACFCPLSAAAQLAHHVHCIPLYSSIGASIITGIEPDAEKGLRSDPSAVICKCVRAAGRAAAVAGPCLCMPPLPLATAARPRSPLACATCAAPPRLPLPSPPRRQLGIRLHELGDHLPIYDTTTGRLIPADLDAAVEK